MKAVIFAAGLGTRLRPITDTVPKALVPVGGVPMLRRVMTRLRDSGVDEFVVNVHHFADKIEAYLAENRNFGAKVSLSVEADGPLETGGAIKKAASLLRGAPFLIHNADILCDFDVKSFIGGVRPEALATLLVREAPSDRYLLFDAGMRLCGWTDTGTGEVRSPYPDFDAGRCRRFAFCGIHVVSDRILPLMQDWPAKFGIIDFYLSVAAEYPIFGVRAEKDMTLVDIGSPESLKEAERLCAMNAFRN